MTGAWAGWAGAALRRFEDMTEAASDRFVGGRVATDATFPSSHQGHAAQMAGIPVVPVPPAGHEGRPQRLELRPPFGSGRAVLRVPRSVHEGTHEQVANLRREDLERRGSGLRTE